MPHDPRSALEDLGLSATEATIYVALLRHSATGPLTAYKLAQLLGRDPANLTKTLGAMVRRGAVIASGQRPRRYAPVPPRDFTGALVARVQARRDQAVAMLEEIGRGDSTTGSHALESRAEGLTCARRLLAEATASVLIDATPEILLELDSDLQSLAIRRDVSVDARSTSPVVLTGLTVAVTGDGASAPPGPWLRLVVDETACLTLVAAPDGEGVLHGRWSRNPAEAFLMQRDMGPEAASDVDRQLHPEPELEPSSDVSSPLDFVYRRKKMD